MQKTEAKNGGFEMNLLLLLVVGIARLANRSFLPADQNEIVIIHALFVAFVRY